MPPLLRALLTLAAVAVGALVLAWLIDVVVRTAAARRQGRLLTAIRRSCRRPFRATVLTGSLLIANAYAGLPVTARTPVGHALRVLTVAAAAWLVVKVVFIAEDAAVTRVPVDVTDNRRARKVRTQIRLLRRFTAAVVVFLAIGFALMTLPGFRTVGASLLASAGFLGVVAGLAAQTTLGNVFAGLQLAFTDALRLDDVVVVENEWGRVEEITLTYVVLALWDERRLVLPTSYFTTTPFQNWTRTESRVLGEVTLHVDYAAPVEEMREEAHRIVAQSPLWDGKDWVLQVVETTPTTVVVRVLASAADAPSAWDLRCEIREKLLAWLQRTHPQGLPHVRLVSQDATPFDPYPTRRDTDVTAADAGRSQFSAD